MSTLVPWIDNLADISQRLGPGLSASIAAQELPPLYKLHQKFRRPLIEDVSAAVAAEFARPEVRAQIRPGARVCLAVGSRGIARIAEIVKATVREVKALGAEPFIIPAMGSHGGATAEGQTRVLEHYDITEATMGAPVVSSIEVKQVGVAEGVPVFCSTDASAADAIIPIGRVKPHTGFRGPIESGLMKMMTIGLGKQAGADTLHAEGMDRFITVIPAAARVILETQPIAFGLAIVENGYDEPARIEAVLPEGLEEREKELLEEARALMPSLPFEKIDVLVIQYIGKNISGSGMDPNICGRFVRSNGPAYTDTPFVTHIVVLDLTHETEGNGTGIGMGDVTTLRVMQKIDLGQVYANCLTSSHLLGAFLPVVMETDQRAIQCAVKTAPQVPTSGVRLTVIKSTLDVGELWVSPALAEEARQHPHVTVSPTASPMEFDIDGSIIAPITCGNK
jgi:hypothetical protein